MIVRRNQLRASKVMQERVMKNEKVQIIWNMIPTKAFGDEKFLKGLELQNTATSEKSSIQVNGLFYAIGHVPNTSFLFDKQIGKSQLDLDDAGYIKTKPGTCFTSVEGVYAAGDVQDKKYRQAVTAAGSGCMAALEAEKYLENQN
jgi:thioredoxin reductase (NADPH)